MASVLTTSGAFSVRAHQGDAKTLLAFNLDKASARIPESGRGPDWRQPRGTPEGDVSRRRARRTRRSRSWSPV